MCYLCDIFLPAMILTMPQKYDKTREGRSPRQVVMEIGDTEDQVKGQVLM